MFCLRGTWREVCEVHCRCHRDDNLVISTDFPHDDSEFPHAIDNFLALPELSDETKRKALWDNCAWLYNL